MDVDINKAKKLIQQGEVVAVPTDTIFGLAVDMYSEEALLKLYTLKKRPKTKPFVIQLAKSHQIDPFLSHIPFDLEKIMHHFWPGPLTLILPVQKKSMPGLLSLDSQTAAFRISQNEATRNLIEKVGPLAITSANQSGHRELLTQEEVEKEFGEDFPVLSSSQEGYLGVASTILAYVDASWVLLRLGALSIKKIAKILGYYPPVVSNLDPKNSQYTLRPQLYLMDQQYDGSIKTVLGFSERAYPGSEKVLLLGSLKEPQKILETMREMLKKIQQDLHPHVWVDMNFPKEGPLKEVAKMLEHSIRVGI